ncbi:hypothetical protein Val02_70680 [Virgisporangium aliadipatigenens]|uniref:Uncharacterized protein n=1 Tax=Virgisporangium aliadipatigenens TaxID=741659 RepID=A0A8J3YTI0_9ACTN|nr:hypothetical protein [Virgisporangium aliadipatigenens]GIJ50182.1 hypothetical protein Val02_70680 [Virgisporangium aliadipatigenens]
MPAFEEQLRDAFAILLGRPLEAFPEGTYATFHWDDELRAELFSPEFGEDADPNELDPRRWQVDVQRSLVLVDDASEVDQLEPMADALDELSFVSGDFEVVRGRDMLTLLGAHGVDPDEIDYFVPVILRVRTDGTLFDALRAATWTMDEGALTEPDEDAEVDGTWAERLSAIADPALRKHFANLCLDAHSARAYGAWFAGTTQPLNSFGSALEAFGAEAVATWEFGEGQATTWVVRLKTDA